MTPHDEIARLVTLYAHLLDDQRYDDWVQLFTEDGIIVFGGAEHRGHDAIKAAVAAVQPVKPGKHFTGYPVVEMETEDEAHVFTDMIGFFSGEDGSITAAGLSRYHDVARRVEGVWRFHARYMHAPGAPIHEDAPRQPVR